VQLNLSVHLRRRYPKGAEMDRRLTGRPYELTIKTHPQSQPLPKPKPSYIIKVYIKTLQKHLTKAPGGEKII